MEIQLVSADALSPNDYNPNRLSAYQRKLLRRSIESDGMIQPVIALKDGTIVDGQHRWETCKELGLDVPVLYVDKSDPRVTTLRMNAARGVNDQILELDLLTTLNELEGADFLQRELLLDDKTLARLEGTHTFEHRPIPESEYVSFAIAVREEDAAIVEAALLRPGVKKEVGRGQALLELIRGET